MFSSYIYDTVRIVQDCPFSNSQDFAVAVGRNSRMLSTILPKEKTSDCMDC